MREFKKYLWLSQVSLFGLLLLCSVIMPSVAIKNGGVSNFGNHRSTVVFYVLAFLLSSLFLSLAALAVQHRPATTTLLLIAFLNILVLLSTFPRQRNQAYSDIHDDLGIVLFSYEFLLSIWFVIKRHTLDSLSWLILEAVGSIIGLLSITKVVHFLFIGQMLGAAGFGLLLVQVLPRIVESDLPDSQKT